MLPPPAIAFLLDLREDQAQKEGGPIVTPDQVLYVCHRFACGNRNLFVIAAAGR